MPQGENLEVVRELIHAFNRGDPARCFDLIDPEVEWEDPHGIPGGGVHHGHDGVQTWFARWLGAWEDFRVMTEELIDAGDHVIAVERLSGRGKSSGVAVEQTWVASYTIRDRRIVRRADYPGKTEALDAVGLQE